MSFHIEVSWGIKDGSWLRLRFSRTTAITRKARLCPCTLVVSIHQLGQQFSLWHGILYATVRHISVSIFAFGLDDVTFRVLWLASDCQTKWLEESDSQSWGVFHIRKNNASLPCWCRSGVCNSAINLPSEGNTLIVVAHKRRKQRILLFPLYFSSIAVCSSLRNRVCMQPNCRHFWRSFLLLRIWSVCLPFL